MYKSILLLFVFISLQVFPQNYSLSFDGLDDFIDLGNSTDFDFGTGNFTVEHWYKSSTTTGAFGASVLKLGHDGNNRYWNLSINTGGTGFPQFFLSNGTGNGLPCPGNIRIDDNQWHHLCGVRDGTNMHLYIDGLLNNTITIPSDASGDNTGKLTLGAMSQLPIPIPIESKLDEVRLWNVALSPNTIKEWLNKRVTSSHPQFANLVGYWKLDEGTGSTILDESSNGNTGIFTPPPSNPNSTEVFEFTDGLYSDNSGSLDFQIWKIGTPDELVEEFTMTFDSYFYYESQAREVGENYYLKVSGRYGIAQGWSHSDAAYNYLADPNGAPDVRWIWNGYNSGTLPRVQRPEPDAPNPDFLNNVDKDYHFYYPVGDTPADGEWSLNSSPVGDKSNYGMGTSNLTATDEVPITIIWDGDDPGNDAIFAGIQFDNTPGITTGLLTNYPSTYWEIWIQGEDVSFNADITFRFDDLPGIGNETELSLFSRTDGSQSWTEVTDYTIGTEGDINDGIGTITANDLSNFSQFILTSNSPDNPLPVELISYTAIAGDNKVTLRWTTGSELSNLGFILEKKSGDNGQFEEMASYVNNSELKGQGNANSQSNYSLTDNSVQNGFTYYYRLSDMDFNGIRTYYNTVSATPNSEGIKLERKQRITSQFQLYQNYPNPFNPETTIKFEVPVAQGGLEKVQLTIYNTVGEQVRHLFRGFLEGGVYEIKWNGLNSNGVKQPSGVYFINYRTNYLSKFRKMLLLK